MDRAIGVDTGHGDIRGAGANVAGLIDIGTIIGSVIGIIVAGIRTPTAATAAAQHTKGTIIAHLPNTEFAGISAECVGCVTEGHRLLFPLAELNIGNSHEAGCAVIYFGGESHIDVADGRHGIPISIRNTRLDIQHRVSPPIFLQAAKGLRTRSIGNAICGILKLDTVCKICAGRIVHNCYITDFLLFSCTKSADLHKSAIITCICRIGSIGQFGAKSLYGGIRVSLRHNLHIQLGIQSIHRFHIRTLMGIGILTAKGKVTGI